MGWVDTTATHFREDGGVDARAEMDSVYTFSRFDGEGGLVSSDRVLDSAMVGSTYYAAIETLDARTSRREVWAGVARTSTRAFCGFTFGYDAQDETEGPVNAECPRRILRLLTPTSNEEALAWRGRCEETLRQRAYGRSLTRLPVGSQIAWRAPKGLSQYAEGQFAILTVVEYRRHSVLYDAERHVRVPTKLVHTWDTREVSREARALMRAGWTPDELWPDPVSGAVEVDSPKLTALVKTWCGAGGESNRLGIGCCEHAYICRNDDGGYDAVDNETMCCLVECFEDRDSALRWLGCDETPEPSNEPLSAQLSEAALGEVRVEGVNVGVERRREEER